MQGLRRHGPRRGCEIARQTTAARQTRTRRTALRLALTEHRLRITINAVARRCFRTARRCLIAKLTSVFVFSVETITNQKMDKQTSEKGNFFEFKQLQTKKMDRQRSDEEKIIKKQLQTKKMDKQSSKEEQ